ncbi:MAG: hypothetical protein IJC48_12550 [Clostridia bacterium]|nr:hypothetical protein [Clostridia bacterium]
MRRMISVILLAIVLMNAISACAYEMRVEDEGFTLIAENGSKALLMDEETLQLRWVDLATGKTWDTSVMNGQSGNRTIKSLQKAALQVTFIVNAQNATTTNMDSYTYSVQTEGFEWRKIDNGVEIDYTIGDDAYIIDDLPKGIRVDRYQALADGAGWSTTEAKEFRDNYRAVKMEGLDQEYMIRVKDDSLSALQIKKLYNVIFSSGIYTQEHMEEDNATVGYVREYSPEVKVTVRYQLDGDDLLFTIPCAEIANTPDNELVSISALPYFLSADNTQEGFIFVPDGSGALINLNNGKLSSTAYSMRVYGNDVLVNSDDYVSERDDIALPVYGIKRTDSAMLAIIEEGEEIASIYANISGRSDEFNRVSTDFLIREIENVALAGNESVTSPRYSTDVYQGNITLRYKWLIEEDSDYVDMAKTYREYLVGNGLLVNNEADEDAAFYMEVVGAANKNKFFLGIPYQSTVQATTISEADIIYDLARAHDVKNIKMIYTGLFDGGIKNSSLTRLTLDKDIGSEKELRELMEKLDENGDMLYPGVYFGRVYTDRAFKPLSDAARKHDGDPAQAYVFGEPVLKRARTEHEGYYVSPFYLPEYTEKAMDEFEDLGVKGLNLFDLGNTLTGDHKRKENLSRIHATPVFENALETLSGEYELILDTPLLYAFRYASGATNLLRGDNGFAITDASIPFVQWVLDGSMSYSGESWNAYSYLGYQEQLLWALESKSSPRFTFMWEDPSIFANTADVDYMSNYSSNYSQVMDEACALYEEYNAFYRKVKDAKVEQYEIYSVSLRKVVYDNGVTLYVNYLDTDQTADGIKVPALGYYVGEGDEA